MNRNYLYSRIHSNVDSIEIESESIYLFGISAEERSEFVRKLINRNNVNTNFIQIEAKDRDIIAISCSNEEYNLRSADNISSLLNKYTKQSIYIDVTGLDNRICAPLIRRAIEQVKTSENLKLNVMYAEPGTYNIKKFKAENVFNDLSEKIEGIEPLPGYATIFPDGNIEDELLVAFLGFEGGRYTYVLENVQTPNENIIPVIGVPGFRPEYPFLTYWGNRFSLYESETWRKQKLVSANSLVEVYLMLQKMIKENPNKRIKVAPIGTKPHAIGAMISAVMNERNIEIVYDNPKRRIKRSEGIGNINEFKVCKLIREN